MTDTIQIPLKNSDKFATIDAADLHLVEGRTWLLLRSSKTKFYAYASGKKSLGEPKTILMHRLLMGSPEGRVVDHDDNDGLMNTRGNLRLATVGENAQNQTLSKNNTSGFKGVNKVANGKFACRIMSNGVPENLGTFVDAIDAAMAYDAAARRLHGEFAKTNESMGLIPTFVDLEPIDELNILVAGAMATATTSTLVPTKVYEFPAYRAERRGSRSIRQQRANTTVFSKVGSWLKKLAA